jgi:hypothetical protein
MPSIVSSDIAIAQVPHVAIVGLHASGPALGYGMYVHMTPFGGDPIFEVKTPWDDWRGA